ncbi:ead/Ea22-like family protein [Pseudomonas aeruginosa]|uniref:ead/Ea22-like family protein n=1 Tax=Pseudomonas aeruginosa TaxID=287 RepID=UPI001E59C6F8|nr:ead/Ea22-like family protein [Pseudomonas aeruginosa]MCD2910693.1 ead/Ea22-like family protein [Pseudomonas aeruginosa]
MTDHAELRRLAEAATPGPWRVQTGCSWRRIGTDSGDGDVLRPCTHPHDGWPDIVAPAENLKYIASANPKTILALLDQIDGLSDELSACTEHPGGCGYWREAAKRRAEERDRLRAQNEALRGALQAVVDDPTWRSNDNTLWPKIIKAMNQPGATSSP